MSSTAGFGGLPSKVTVPAMAQKARIESERLGVHDRDLRER
jgi:hypothetical protein